MDGHNYVGLWVCTPSYQQKLAARAGGLHREAFNADLVVTPKFHFNPPFST